MNNTNRSENFRMYYQIQYSRIDHLETKRENFSNYVLTISSGIYALTISNTENISSLIILSVLAFVVLINSISILFILKTWPLIKMHQKRAKKARLKYSADLYRLNESVKKPNSKFKIYKKYYVSTKRHNIYIYLHAIIILFFIIVSYCSYTKEVIEMTKPYVIKILK
jgi:multisubunit Na+/H+ antiporter MnhG subunit